MKFRQKGKRERKKICAKTGEEEVVSAKKHIVNKGKDLLFKSREKTHKCCMHIIMGHSYRLKSWVKPFLPSK